MTEWDNDRQRGFWEACGFDFTGDARYVGFPDGTLHPISDKPDIHDLNAIFKHAVPKAHRKLGTLRLEDELEHWARSICRGDKLSPESAALSLAEAIEKVLAL